MKIDAGRLRALVKSQGLTNTNLAAKAGISRQALQTMLRQDGVIEIRDRTVKGLVQALRLTDECLLSPDPLAGYKKAVLDDNTDLSFAGLGLPATDPKSMEDVYVPVKVIPVCERRHDDTCPPSADALEETQIEEPELKVEHCLLLQRRVLIHGEPGSGKTTALRHTARAYAAGPVANNATDRSRLPLMVRLADFAKARESDGQMSIVRFVVTRALRDASPDFSADLERNIENELKRGGCLVLLDGLDEVGSDMGLFPVLSSFVSEFGQNHFVLTSRTIGLDPEPWQKLGFSTFQVTPWDEEDIREFTRRWYAARSLVGKQQKKQLEQRAESLTTLIMNHRPLRAIASNPLMLTILSALHYANASLPRRRVDLYARIVDVMMETWEANKRGARPGDPLHGIVLESREFGWLLGRLALEMQRKGRLLRPRWWVNDCVQEFLQEQMALDGSAVKEQTDRVIRYLCERTGLLVERGDNLFGFGHRTFQEYFAARGLLLEAEGGADIVALLRQYLFHPLWEEVIVYVAASLAAPRATTLLRVILDDPDPAGRFLHRGQSLVLRCLIDGATIADRVLLDQVFSEGEVIGTSRWLGISIKFIHLLKQLLFTRHDTEARRMITEIETAAKKKLPVSDYATVYFSSHDPLDPPKDDAPGAVCRKWLGGRPVKMVWLALKKRLENPHAWFKEALKRVRNSKTELASRIALISMLGDEADSNATAKNTLKKLLEADPLPEIRAHCAEALGQLASFDIAQLLLDSLNHDKSDLVRASCALALRSVAPKVADVRSRLENLFGSGSEEVRAGAARGLSLVNLLAPEHKVLLNRMLATIKSSADAESVRCACIWAVASFLGQDEVARIVENCLDDCDVMVKLAALHVLSDAVMDGEMEWSDSLAEKMEAMLMAISDPCPHLFHDLVALVAMKEIHGQRRLDRLLREGLMSFGDRIKMAFVFGSVARLKQGSESDIDLMVIGEVRLKELAAALHTAAQTLGRPVNPVLFSAENFRQQYRQGNPLLLDIVRKEKIFLKGNQDELTKLVADGIPA